MGCAYQREHGSGIRWELRCVHEKGECSDPDGRDPMSCNYCEQTPEPCPQCNASSTPVPDRSYLCKSGHELYWCPHCEQVWKETEDLITNYEESIYELAEHMAPLLELVHDGKASEQALNDLARDAAFLAAMIQARDRVKDEL